MYTFGKLLQAIGLILPLVGFFRAFAEPGEARGLAMLELSMLGAGVVAFLIGTAIVRRSSS